MALGPPLMLMELMAVPRSTNPVLVETKTALVPVLRISTCAPRTMAPCGSVTLPEIEPRPCWAWTTHAVAVRNRIIRRDTFMRRPRLFAQKRYRQFTRAGGGGQ